MSLRLATLLAAVVVVGADAAVQTGTIPFTFSRSDYASDPGARGIVVGDFDNDGAMDFATANAGGNTVDVFLNREFAGGGFTVTRYAVGAGPFDIASADINYDGYPDLVVAAADADEIDVLLGGPGGAFHPPQRYAAPGNPRGVAVEWLGFGGYTIVYSSYALGTVSLLNYDYQSATFEPGLTLRAGASPQGIAIGTFKPNGGYPDIAVANAGGSPITLLYNNGDGTFTRDTLPGATNLNVIVSADFDGDGRRDLAAASTGQNFAAIYLGSSSGLHWVRNIGAGALSSPRGIAAADLNADGHPDLLVASRRSASVAVFVADAASASSVFSTYQIVKSGPGSRAVAAADFDGDGRIDMATADEYAAAATVLANSTAASGGTGATAWELKALPDATPGAWAKGGPFAVADFNHNGVPDVVVGDGVVLDGTTAVKVDGGRQSPFVTAAVVGDFNEDGNADIAWVVYYYVRVNSTTTSALSVDFLIGDGTGHFTSGPSVPLNLGYGIAVADFNGDGHLDLVAMDEQENRSIRKLLLGRGDGTFAEVDQNSRQYDVLRAAADIDGDGRIDLVVWNGDLQQIGVYLGDGTGTFPTERLAAPLSGLYEVQVADLNGDGHPDLVAIRQRSVVTWLGNGDGTFGDPVFSDIPDYAYDVRLADFTGDGYLDALTDGGTLAVGRGDGTFGNNRRIDITFNSAVTADIDRDGRPDLFIGTYDYTAMALFNRTAEQPNAPPVLAVTPTDLTFAFPDQFGEEPPVVSASRSYDPNLDPIAFVWSENGQVIATGSTLYLNLPSGSHRITLVVRDNAGAESRQTVNVVINPYEEIVAHTAYMASVYGAWVQTQDATAADRYMVWHPNAYAPKVTAPLANPKNFFSLSFPADPTQEYKLWIRLKAQGDDPYNDSVYVQFDGAVDAAGAPAYPVDTASALAVNLEECSGCGLSGWGWRDEAWGAKGAIGSTMLRFPAGPSNRMWHYLRIQTREDGVMIDQVILSAVKYKSTRPGAVKNDTTIVPVTIPRD